jgi:hypothetical protein
MMKNNLAERKNKPVITANISAHRNIKPDL